MPEITTIGREIIREKLPEKYKKYASGTLDKSAVSKLMTKIALEDPDAYVDVLQDLNNVAMAVVSTYGRDTALPYSTSGAGKAMRTMNSQLREMQNNILNDRSLTPKQKEDKLVQLGYKYSSKVQQAVMDDNNKRHTALASQINSGSRGKPVQLMQLQFGNMMMVDALNRTIPYMHIDPYISGTSPFSYWVSASSGRKGNWDVQAATGASGYLGKQVTQATHATPISMQDCGTKDTGVAFKANDSKNIGAVLLRPFHNHPAGSIVTDDMIAEADDDEEMILRSPMTCRAAHGVCQRCSGLAENGKFPAIGDYVALNAARSFVEPATQGAVGCLHPETKVRMADWSIKSIKDIKVGDTVIGVSVDGTASPVKVTNVFHNGLKPMFVWRYRRGNKTGTVACVAATANHKALQSTQKTNCKDEANNNVPRIMTLGTKTHSIGVVPLQASASFGSRHVPEALYLGLMLGDGCYTKKIDCRPHFSCADPSLIEDTKEYLASLGISCRFQKGSECYWRLVGTEEANVKGKVTQKSNARRLLEEHGLIGKYAHEKQLPADWKSWDNESLSAIVSGLIITDGCLARLSTKNNSPYVSFASTSLSLVRQFTEALKIGCGVTCKRIKRSMSGRRVRPIYAVSYADKKSVYAILRWIKLYGVKEKKRLSYLEELEEWHKTAPLGQRITRWPLVSKIPLGLIPSIDIEVDHPDHLFLLANGLVVSNSKHQGGVGVAKAADPEGEDQPTGFTKAEQFLRAPSTFQGGAVLSDVDGVVDAVEAAPQGGHYITVAGKKLYASPYRTITVKPGQKVFAGDKLTNGVPNPVDYTSLRGIGAGRTYYTKQLGSILSSLGWGTDRRNLEQFSRALLNKVRITGEDGYDDWLPGDVVDYSVIQSRWKPRKDSKDTDASKAIGKYLEKPMFSYTIGTKITKDVADDLEKHGFGKITVNDNPPPFQSEFMRPTSVLQNDEHWLPRLSGERLKDSLFDSARRGTTDEYDSPSYVDKLIIQPYKPGQI